MSTDIERAASDGAVLGMTVFEPDSPAVGSVLIASAMGVPRRFYRGFAGFLCERGHRVLTVDYRGVGSSAGVPGTTLADWGDLDLTAGVAELTERGPDLPLRFVGHSVGGQLLGLLPEVKVERALLVASQSGYWKHWSGLWTLQMLLLWFVLIPVLSRVLGRFPAAILGGGDDLPPGVAQQWAQWGRDPGYIMGFAAGRPQSGFTKQTCAIRALAFTDDPMAPEPAVRALAQGFRGTEVEVVPVSPASMEMKNIAHFGAFRRDATAKLWPSMADWLFEGVPQTSG